MADGAGNKHEPTNDERRAAKGALGPWVPSEEEVESWKGDILRRARARDAQQLADERAREFWEKAVLDFARIDTDQCEEPETIAKWGDELTAEWRKRFAPTHPAAIAQAASESCANPSAWLLLGEAVYRMQWLLDALEPPNSAHLDRWKNEARAFCEAHKQAREDWRKQR